VPAADRTSSRPIPAVEVAAGGSVVVVAATQYGDSSGAGGVGSSDAAAAVSGRRSRRRPRARHRRYCSSAPRPPPPHLAVGQRPARPDAKISACCINDCQCSCETSRATCGILDSYARRELLSWRRLTVTYCGVCGTWGGVVGLGSFGLCGDDPERPFGPGDRTLARLPQCCERCLS
jgi:hypothetical protein